MSKKHNGAFHPNDASYKKKGKLKKMLLMDTTPKKIFDILCFNVDTHTLHTTSLRHVIGTNTYLLMQYFTVIKWAK